MYYIENYILVGTLKIYSLSILFKYRVHHCYQQSAWIAILMYWTNSSYATDNLYTLTHLATTGLVSVSKSLITLDFFMWMITHSISFLHILLNISTPHFYPYGNKLQDFFLFIGLSGILLYTYHTFFTHVLINGYVVCCHFSVTV